MSGRTRKAVLLVGVPLLVLLCFGGLYLKSRAGEQRIRSDSACPNRIVGEVHSGRFVRTPLILPCRGGGRRHAGFIDLAESSPDGNRLRLTFEIGKYPCGSLSEVRVRRGAVRVVTMWLQNFDDGVEGTKVGRGCVDIALFRAIEIRLKEPLEQGVIEDGSNGRRIRVKVDPQL